MKACTLLIAAGCVLAACSPKYDVCIYGGSSSGVMAAYSAAQMGQKVLVIEPTVRFGGLTTGGLGLCRADAILLIKI